jgi:hypothetical protein
MPAPPFSRGKAVSNMASGKKKRLPDPAVVALVMKVTSQEWLDTVVVPLVSQKLQGQVTARVVDQLCDLLY